jgi:predicted MPP superfamily phosphohydrolase
LLYGALVEANRLELEVQELRLPRWPARLDGFRIALLADFHLRDVRTMEHAHRALTLALEHEPDVVVMPGDLVGRWKPESDCLIRAAFGPLKTMDGAALATPGNHDYYGGTADQLEEPCAACGVAVLRNEAVNLKGVTFVGIDSANARRADPYAAFMAAPATGDPTVVLWHEPDLVDYLPQGPSLMLSGHSHGGQFLSPWGWAPMLVENGRRYVRGFYPDAPTPLYVTRGVGTTGPPSRLFCPPEVALLVCRSA